MDIFKNESTAKFNDFIKSIEIRFLHANLSFHSGGEDATGKTLKKMLENLNNLKKLQVFEINSQGDKNVFSGLLSCPSIKEFEHDSY